MFSSTFLRVLLLLTLQGTPLSNPTTRSITGTFSTTPPAAERSSTERGGEEGEEGSSQTSSSFTTTTPPADKEIRTNSNEDTTSTSWVTGTTSDNGVVTGATPSPQFNQQVNRPYCIINGQFYYAGQ